ncbi:MAG: hypothetical protein C6P37_16485 [Caldibacillus debilis]|uniref:Uncharacterized protein n=1 Tax=Caldibacillus debilis TaxID=301148 RepID=A0A3E0JVV0_9BACI|nr:hypothetical protein [Bacillaceae bacterium]OUM89829.1 MAG: hypothetical protein BAA03_15580 [Caldibacillus debilis]REJ13148.1 MAG: hypothetical protein C6W57_17030 [Caldibacillus debilis]REJ23850.1 MAG: hypothetical protein C6P37_16485 [Caldibacillus debilis]REJ29308.1 MAG: hypothetical protein C6W56_06165 [Caldibacillus debilis]
MARFLSCVVWERCKSAGRKGIRRQSCGKGAGRKTLGKIRPLGDKAGSRFSSGSSELEAGTGPVPQAGWR